MILQALKANTGVDVATAISNLEGFSFIGLKGQETVRATDHLLIQSMYLVSLNKVGSHYKPTLVKTLRNVTT